MVLLWGKLYQIHCRHYLAMLLVGRMLRIGTIVHRNFEISVLCRPRQETGRCSFFVGAINENYCR